jgi:[ribosomal protein S5]-alanine N-acetyltransferase
LPHRVIETDRLVLRPIEPDDLDAFAALHADPEVADFIGGVKTREEAAEWLARRSADYRRQGYGIMAVVEKATGDVVGRCGLAHWDIEGEDELEVGYAFVKSAWGRGYATEAASAARDYALEELGRTRLIALIRRDNPRSARVAEKLGLTHERDVLFHGSMCRLFALTARP